MDTTLLSLFLCGDVMTGRGIDRIMAKPCPPRLYEPAVKDAGDYVAMAERANGPIPAPVDPAYIWGEALTVLAQARPDVRVINLETAVTRSEDAADKGINYRMSPENAGCLTAAGVDACVLANNHVLDWGRRGLEETLDVLHGLDIRTAGAGRDPQEAFAPAVIPVPGKGRVLVYGIGHSSSGIPAAWAAHRGRPGLALVPELSNRSAEDLGARIGRDRLPGDLVVVSVHWGSNWGYTIRDAERAFAHALVDKAGVDIVHGHSSHHPKAGEVRNGKLILYGCGDFLNDYEGIMGHETFRGDLVLMYFARFDHAARRLDALEMVPMQTRKFRLVPPSRADTELLAQLVHLEWQKFGASVELRDPGLLHLVW